MIDIVVSYLVDESVNRSMHQFIDLQLLALRIKYTLEEIKLV